MVATIGASSGRYGRGGRPILSAKRNETAPEEAALVATYEPEHHTPFSPEDQFAAHLWDARNRWSIERYQSGLVSDRRLSRTDAERAWSVALSGMRPAEGNRLSSLRAGGEK